jgi:hypothetical protein
LALRKKLREILTHEFHNVVVEGPEFNRFVRLIYEAMPGELHWPTLEDSARPFLGTIPTAATLDPFCWRLAGNVPQLRGRRVVLPWQRQFASEWVPFQITAVRRTRSGRGKPGAALVFQALAGTVCPQKLVRFWSLRQCHYLAGDFGFSRRGRGQQAEAPLKYPYSQPAQLVQLRLYGLVTPELSQREPMFKLVKWPDAIQEYNRHKLRQRFRVDPGYKCPRGFPKTFPCHQCPAGYKQCVAATHADEWVQKPCSACARDKAFFDPGGRPDICVDCAIKASMTR